MRFVDVRLLEATTWRTMWVGYVAWMRKNVSKIEGLILKWIFFRNTTWICVFYLNISRRGITTQPPRHNPARITSTFWPAQSLSWSRNSPLCTEPESSSPCSQQTLPWPITPTTRPHTHFNSTLPQMPNASQPYLTSYLDRFSAVFSVASGKCGHCFQIGQDVLTATASIHCHLPWIKDK